MLLEHLQQNQPPEFIIKTTVPPLILQTASVIWECPFLFKAWVLFLNTGVQPTELIQEVASSVFVGLSWQQQQLVVFKLLTGLGLALDVLYLDELRKGLVDEDKRDEEGEDLLREGWDVAHQETALGSNHHQDDEDEPEPDPHAAGQVLKALGLAELRGRGGGEKGEKEVKETEETGENVSNCCKNVSN